MEGSEASNSDSSADFNPPLNGVANGGETVGVDKIRDLLFGSPEDRRRHWPLPCSDSRRRSR